MRPALTVTAAALLALTAALPAAAQPADGGDCADGAASPALAEIELAPTAAPGTAAFIETYSGNPFITFKFPCAVTAELTALTLNGEDVLEDLWPDTSSRWTLALNDLALGRYELVYSARDGAGNTVEGVRYLFRVSERPPYRIPLEPGWNLISFPGRIYEPEVGSIIGPDKKADVVLGYEDGKWTTALRTEDGWHGSLTEFRYGYGYWVRTTKSEDLEALLPEVDTSYEPTPVALRVRDWNLLGTIDNGHHPVGSTRAVHKADEYFSNLCGWKAYGYNARLQAWVELQPGSTPPATVENGKGYWVWSRGCHYH